MSILSTIKKPENRAPIITISGDAGTGKTTLAALFENPIFIRAEDGLMSIPMENRPDAFPVLQSGEQIYEQLAALIKEEHEYKTLVIDSVTQLDQFFVADVLRADGKAKSINTAMGGYGAGLQAVGSMHQRVRKAAGMLNEQKNMAVIFIAHSEMVTVELPNEEPFMRYDLRLNKRSVSHYVDNVDIVAYLRIKMFVTGDEGNKRVTSTGEREITCYPTPENVSKNRYGIAEKIAFKWGTNPFQSIIKGV